MEFRYIGSSDDMTAYGYDFRNGNEPDVTDEKAVVRLAGNRFFEAIPTEGETAQDEEPLEEEAEEMEASQEEPTLFVADVITEAQAVTNDGAEPLPSLVAAEPVIDETPVKNKGGRPRKAQPTEA
jgi:hypothetical protein